MNDQSPQYFVTTHVGGEVIRTQEIDDPFITNFIEIGAPDVAAAAAEGKAINVVVAVGGTPHAIRHVMRPIDLVEVDLSRPPSTATGGVSTEGSS